MSKLTIPEAVKVVPVSESTLRRDIRTGKVSSDVDSKDRKVVDTAELARVYEIAPEALNGNGGHESQPMTADDSKAIVAILERQVEGLEKQLEHERTVNTKLLGIVETQANILPAPETEQRSGILAWLLGR